MAYKQLAQLTSTGSSNIQSYTFSPRPKPGPLAVAVQANGGGYVATGVSGSGTVNTNDVQVAAGNPPLTLTLLDNEDTVYWVSASASSATAYLFRATV